MIATRASDSRNLLVALDIGTSEIVTLVAEITSEDKLNLIGMGSYPSRGLKKAWWSTRIDRQRHPAPRRGAQPMADARSAR